MIRKLWMKWRTGGLGLLSQVFTLGATFLPIAWGAGDGLVVLVVATAVATTTTPALSLAAQYRLPLTRTPSELTTAVLSSSLACLVGSTLAAAVTFAIATSTAAPSPAGWAAAVGGLAGAQGGFGIAVAVLVRAGGYSPLMRARLAYGATTLIATLIALIIGGTGLALCGAAALGYVAGGMTALRSTQRLLRQRNITAPRPALRGVVRHARGSAVLAVSATVGALAGQLGALATPLLGGYSVSWASAIRTMSGFQTVGTIVVGAAIDADLARAMRHGDGRSMQTITRNGEAIGMALGAVSTAAILVALAWVEGVRSIMSVPVLVAVVFYCATNVALAPIGRALGMLGRARLRLIWDVMRCALLVLAIVMPTPTWILSAFGVAGALSYIAYAALLRYALR